MKFKEGDRACVEAIVVGRGESPHDFLIELKDGTRIWVDDIVDKIYHAGGEVKNGA